MTDELAPLPPAQAAELRQVARGEIRRWLGAAGDAAILQRIDSLGAEEIEAAAALSVRLGTVPADQTANDLLDQLNRLVAAIHEPPARKGWLGLGGARVAPIEERLRVAEPEFARLLDALARERDRLARGLVSGRTLDERFAGAEHALERAVHVLRLVADGAEAAGRELRGENPPLAAFLTGDAAIRAAERARDALTQLAVLRQGRLSLRLLCDGQEAMTRAIDRTRTTLVSALRTAVAATGAAVGGTRLAERAATLDAAEARRTVEAAVGEMRAALAER